MGGPHFFYSCLQILSFFSQMWVVVGGVGGGVLLSRDIFQAGGLVLQSAYIRQGTKTPTLPTSARKFWESSRVSPFLQTETKLLVQRCVILMLEVLDVETFPLDTLFRKSCCRKKTFDVGNELLQFEVSSTRRVRSYNACVGGWVHNSLQKPTGPSAPLTLCTESRILFVHIEIIDI